MKKALILAAVASTMIAGAANAGMVVSFGATNAIPANNDFQAFLNGLGLTRYATTGSSISFNEAGTLTFEYLGSESGFTDTFFYGANSFVENNNMDTLLDFMFSVSVGPGAFDGYFMSSGRGAAQFGDGTPEFGIFLGPNAVSGLDTNVLWFGLDDQITGDDDNHDDFIIKATFRSAVPEPAVIGLFGLGLLGLGVARRRRTA